MAACTPFQGGGIPAPFSWQVPPEEWSRIVPMESTFVKPRYDTGGFASLPQRLTLLTDPQKYDAVVLFLMDGFGWRFFEKFQEAPFLKTVARARDRWRN